MATLFTIIGIDDPSSPRTLSLPCSSFLLSTMYHIYFLYLFYSLANNSYISDYWPKGQEHLHRSQYFRAFNLWGLMKLQRSLRSWGKENSRCAIKLIHYSVKQSRVQLPGKSPETNSISFQLKQFSSAYRSYCLYNYVSLRLAEPFNLEWGYSRLTDVLLLWAKTRNSILFSQILQTDKM